MAFTPENMQDFLSKMTEEDRIKASDLLSSPDKFSNFLKAHHESNEEARINRQSLKSIMSAAGFEFTKSELVELANNIERIHPNGEFDPEIYAEVLSEYGAREAIESGEIEADELGLIEDESTGEIFVDEDDGEIYVDDEGILRDGNGYLVDEDGDYTDEPVYEDDIVDPSVLEMQDEYNARMAELEEKEAAIERRQMFIKYGVNPEVADKFGKIYEGFETEDGAEPTEEQMREHFASLRQSPLHAGFFSNAGASPEIQLDGGMIRQKMNTSKQIAMQNGDVLGVLAATEYEK